MFQEIKYRLLEIFLTQKKKLILFSCLIFVGLFVVSQTTHAFVLDLANVQLDALDFLDKIVSHLVSLALLTIESATLLIISANLLDWSSSLPVGLDNGIVNAGWNFMSDLANLAFILIFIVIALSYILNLGNLTLAMKKALPRLIIVAFLVNFSLLFVKMLSDIGWIAQGSFRSVFFDGGGFATAAMEPLKASAFSLIRVIIGIPAAYMFVALVPYANIVALLSIGGLILTGNGGALTGTISQTILVIVFNFIMSFIFLIFTALFLIRIAVIWILAIFAPLAFMAYILPNTKKYFDNWLKTLMQWSLLGVVAFFLAGLGIKLFGLITIDAGQGISFEEGEVLGKWEFFGTFYKYIFLIIYLVVVLGACKKLTPAGVQMIWGLGEKAIMRGAQWTAGQSRKWGTRAQVGTGGAISGAARRFEEKIKGELLPNKMERAARWITRRTGGLELAEAQVAQSRSRLIEEQRKAIVVKTKDLDEDGVKAVLRKEFELHKRKLVRNKEKTAALYKLLADKKILKDDDKGDLYDEAWKAAGPEEVKNNPVKKAVLASYPQFGTPTETKAQVERAAPADIEKWDRSAKENSEVIKEVVATLRADLITRLGGQSTISSQKIQTEIENSIGKAFEKLVSGATDITKLKDKEQKILLRQMEVIKHLHTSMSPEVQTWKKYGTMKEKQPDSVDALITALRKVIK